MIGNGDLETVLARIAGARHEDAGALKLRGGQPMKGMSSTPGRIAASAAAARGPCSASSARPASTSSESCGSSCAQKREILRLGGGVDDEEQPLVAPGQARHHQIVENAAVLGEQLRVARAFGREALDIGGNEALDQRARRRGRRGSPGPYARRRRGRPSRACADARRRRRSDNAAAAHSRRRAPCARRDDDAARRAASFPAV